MRNFSSFSTTYFWSVVGTAAGLLEALQLLSDQHCEPTWPLSGGNETVGVPALLLKADLTSAVAPHSWCCFLFVSCLTAHQHSFGHLRAKQWLVQVDG